LEHPDHLPEDGSVVAVVVVQEPAQQDPQEVEVQNQEVFHMLVVVLEVMVMV
jgi:hypothetical protein